MERRKSRDIWARLFILANFVAWLVLFVSLVVFHFAQPEFETVFDRFYRLDVRTYWDMEAVRYVFLTLALGLAISVGGLMLSLFRARRKTDHRKPIIILGGLYLVLFIAFLLLR